MADTGTENAASVSTRSIFLNSLTDYKLNQKCYSIALFANLALIILCIMLVTIVFLDHLVIAKLLSVVMLTGTIITCCFTYNVVKVIAYRYKLEDTDI